MPQLTACPSCADPPRTRGQVLRQLRRRPPAPSRPRPRRAAGGRLRAGVRRRRRRGRGPAPPAAEPAGAGDAAVVPSAAPYGADRRSAGTDRPAELPTGPAARSAAGAGSRRTDAAALGIAGPAGRPGPPCARAPSRRGPRSRTRTSPATRPTRAAAPAAGGRSAGVRRPGGTVDADGYCEHCGHAQPRRTRPQERELAGVAAVSDRGLRHHRNEDAFALGDHPLPDGSARRGRGGLRRGVLRDPARRGVGRGGRRGQRVPAGRAGAAAPTRDEAMHDALMAAAERGQRARRRGRRGGPSAPQLPRLHLRQRGHHRRPCSPSAGSATAARYWIPDDRGGPPPGSPRTTPGRPGWSRPG